MQVPAKWRDFPMRQHAGDSSAGALACVAAAAIHLGLIQRGESPVADLLAMLPPENRDAIVARLDGGGGQGGVRLTDKFIRLAAQPVGLIVYRPADQTIDQFRECLYPWMALVKDDRGDLTRPEAAPASSRHVLVLGWLDGDLLVIGDPHRGRPPLYVQPVAEFAERWRRARPPRRPPWSAVLWRQMPSAGKPA